MTNADGEVRFENLAPGDYQLSREQATATSRGVTVRGGLDTQIVTIRPNETTHAQIGSRLELVTVGIDPVPPPAFQLQAHDAKRIVTADVLRPGVYSFRVAPNAQYDLFLVTSYSSGTYIGFVPADYSGQVLSFQLGGNNLQFRVTKKDMPVAGMTVRLITAVGGPAGWAVTGADGGATIGYLQPGAYSAVINGVIVGSAFLRGGRTDAIDISVD